MQRAERVPAWRSLLDRLDATRTVEPRFAGRVSTAQIDALVALLPVLALVTQAVGAVLLVTFWSVGPRRYLAAQCTLLLLGYVALVLGLRRRRRSPRPMTTADVRQRVLFSAVMGVAWGIVPIVLTPFAGPEQRLVLAATVGGLISGGLVLAPIAPAAIVFMGLTTAGALVSLLVEARIYDIGLAVLIICSVGLALPCIVYLNRGFVRPLVDRARLEEQSELIALLLREFEENASDWLWETDGEHRLQRVSDRMAAVAQLPAATMDGRTLHSWSAIEGCEVTRRLCEHQAARTPFRDLVLPLRVDGTGRWWSLSGKAVFDAQGDFIGYRGVGSDVTAAKQSEERIAYLARYDTLTGLPNRVLFQDALRQACERGDEEGLALLCLDLDEFKAVNDSMGHATGDALLVAVAERLHACVREGDMVARLGGDEFAVVTAGADSERAAALARRIVQRVSEPYHIDGVPLGIGVSVGIALVPQDGTAPQTLMKRADLALYRAKAQGRGTWCFFEAEMDARAQARRALQSDLRLALANDEFRLHFQPIMDLATSQVTAVEALLRWQHPTRGMIPPADFIPVAEESGTIVPIGAWVLREACRQAASWPGRVRVAVNLSPVQFRDGMLVDVVESALRESGLEPDRLELEITESIFLEATDTILATLHSLRARGIRVALDDFGTGYSSLSYLRSFPFDKIKIDRSFIRDLEDNQDCMAIIHAITGLALTLGMVTTAEGVETQQQLDTLRARGCSQVQGFLFSRPTTADTVAAFITERMDRGAAPSTLAAA